VVWVPLIRKSPNRTKKRDGKPPVELFAAGELRVNEAGNYTKPGMRKSLFNSIKVGG